MVYYIYVLVPGSMNNRCVSKTSQKIKLKKKKLFKVKHFKKYLTYNFELRSSTQDQ